MDKRAGYNLVKYRYIYLLIIPGILYYAIFCYGPMYGIMLAFKRYNASLGITGSPWVGLQHFRYLFSNHQFYLALRNTIIISFSRIAIQFPIPILIAILFNEIKDGKLKKSLQTVYTFPNFLSWVIISGIVINFLSSDGVINNLLNSLGRDDIMFMSNSNLFRPILYFTDIWKSSGWTSIIYLAAIVSIPQEQYEAATVDGANRLHKILYITLPALRSTIIVMLLLAIGNVMNAGFDQIFNMQNATVRDVSEVLDTYIYRITFQAATDFSFSTAVGLFKSVVNFMFLFSFNQLAKRFGERGIF